MKVLVLVLAFVAIVKCDYSFNMKMEYFKNGNPLPNEKFKFKFCMFIHQSDKCESTLITQVLGDSVITEKQFGQTTQFLSFKIPNGQIESRDYLFNLSISVLGQNERVVSTWNLFIAKESSFLRLDQWIRYNQFKFDLDQQLTFSYNLKCFDGFKGAQCSIPVCDLNCRNNGKCVRENGKQLCRCDHNLFKGDLCEIRIVHSCVQCLNGGSCFGNQECLCPPGYGGRMCEIKKSESECGFFSCQNSGKCFIDNQNEYSCVCPSGFSGKRCQIQATTTTKTTTKTTKSTTQSTTIFITQSTTPYNAITSTQTGSLNGHEIVLILIAGVGVPILFILVAVIFYKTVVVEKKSGSNDVECGKKINPIRDEIKEKKENIYVICQSNSTNSNQSEFKKSSVINSNEPEVYSSCIYEDLNQYAKIGAQNIPALTREINNYSSDLATYV